jgi:diguanylate cyclase (GGDEF)-like protein
MTFGEMLRAVREIWLIPKSNPELLAAQFKAFTLQLPLMYLILMINTWGLAITHVKSAPGWLTIGAPAVMTIVSVWRSVIWWRFSQHDVDSDVAFAALVRTYRLSGVTSIIFTLWALALFPYGDAYAKAHVAFYMAITVIGVIFCMMHLRPAAFTVAFIVNGFFAVFFALSGNLVFVAIAINTTLVCAALLVILLIQYRDFTQMVSGKAENFRLANLDSLTNLPNRRAFFSYLEIAYQRAKSQGTVLAAGIIDLDGFKPVNDIYGHAVGDKLLCDLGQRLVAVCTESVYIARIGGDEFALVVDTFDGVAGLIAIGEQLCLALRAPSRLGDATIQISCSIGLSVFPDTAIDPDTLFAYADYALYQAKRSGRGKVILFSDRHDAEIRRDACIEQALQQADLEKELSVVFQPIMQLSSQSAVGFEALARWSSPVLGNVPPDQFIPLAERIGLIRTMTQVLLRKALSVAQQWPVELRLSFNLSAHDLGAPETVAELIDIIVCSAFDPLRLDLEVTETALIRDFSKVQNGTKLLRDVGCGISLDDFGTGFSSLTHLHGLPLTKIKVDRSFVTGLDKNPASYKIIKSLLALSRDMGVDCIVEGVETGSELAALTSLGGQFVQGYFYSQPIESSQVAKFLEQSVFSKKTDLSMLN